MTSRRTRTVLTTLGFLAIAAFFLTTEHRAHLFGLLPFLLLLACPFLHLFMHAGHEAHGAHGAGDRDGIAPRTDAARDDSHASHRAAGLTGVTPEDIR